jgi:hypothetical protein
VHGAGDPAAPLLDRVAAAGPAEQLLLLARLAGAEIELDPDEANAALRRAELLLAAGGDPHRALEVDGRAVTSLADDLLTSAHGRSLAAGLERLAGIAGDGHPLAAPLRRLRDDPALAGRCWAAALLAEELTGDL